MLRAEGKKKGVHLHHEGAPVFFPGKILKAKLIILIGLLLLTACSREKEDAAFLQHVDSLADMIPEQADTLLSSSQDSSHYARLLRVKVDDKLYRPVTGYEPLVIDTLLPYFQRHGDSHRLSTALFYAGRICADKGDAPQAIDYYQQTLNALPEGESPRFRGLIHSQIGTLFLYQELFEDAISNYKKAFNFQKADKDTVGMIFDLRDIGFCFLNNTQADSSLFYMRQALDVAKLSHNKEMITDVMGQLANIHLALHNFSEAKKCISPALENIDSASISSIYYIVSNIYYETQQQDSAVYYYNKLLQYGNVYGKQSAFLHLSEIALKDKKYHDFMNLQDSLRTYNDSIKFMDKDERVSRIHSLYNYQLREHEIAKLENQKLKQNALWMTFVLMILVILLLSILTGLYFRRQKNIEKKRRLQTEKLLLLEKERSKNYIDQNQQQILNLQKQIEEATNDQLEKLQFRIKELETSSKLYEIEKERRESAMFMLKKTDIFFHIVSLLKDNAPMKSQDFNILSEEIDHYFPDFRRILFSLYGMKKQEYNMCMLMKVELSITDIATLMSRADNSISMSHRRLFSKMFPRENEQPFGSLRELIRNI